MIAVVDSGIANLGSVHKALLRIGANAVITDDPETINASNGVVFPGVGAFAHASRVIRDKGLDILLVEKINSGTPFLGICLGLQLLLSCSEEHNPGDAIPTGLNVIKGSVKRFPPGLPIPHVGWNRAILRKPHPLMNGLGEGSYFYFTHSYYIDPAEKETILTETEYNGIFVSSVATDNLMGVQFHPEKSGPAGLQLLSNFVAMVKK